MKSKSRSVLISYEMTDERVQMYFVPDHTKLRPELRAALKAIRGCTINGDELTDAQHDAYAVFNASITTEEGREYLESQHLEFAGLLLPYELETNASFDVPHKLILIRIGFIS